MLKHAPLALCALALAGCGQPRVEEAPPLAVDDISPSDGATGVDAAAVPTVCFNRAMDASRAAGALFLELQGGGSVSGQSLAAALDARCLSLRHDALQSGSTYLIRAVQGLKSADGEALSSEVRLQFETTP